MGKEEKVKERLEMETEGDGRKRQTQSHAD
jgi:hypothetical protein